ncbi:hypothetical protein [Mucilaginibacter pedocola]|uniref:Uncharacterized protein n=1 Tax=Mucilaginibacter pedocola TaxID=1792845 RepID=A0A1S9P8U2_9SPHI|nr:hypothetical protein [Mucilaginibacter pedocola]OOQ57365.1 hypothetical protein BC343_14775 [Mucilaginibacter pedocola]
MSITKHDIVAKNNEREDLMLYSQTTAFFGDDELLIYIKENKIRFQTDSKGLIEFLPFDNGEMPALEVPLNTRNIQLDTLKISGGINAKMAQSFIANSLEIIVDGGFDAPCATDIEIRSLKHNPEYIVADSAFIFDADKLEKSGPIFLGNNIAHVETDALFFSGKLGSKKKISMFNKNTGFVKVNSYPWLPLDTMKDIISGVYERGRNHKQYIKFLDTCEEKRSPKPF